jgi:hypothetical protein
MTEERARYTLPHAVYERVESLKALEDMFDELVPQASRIIRVFDRSLSARYNTAARCDLLRQFLRADPLNRLFIVLHDAGDIPRAAPRFVSLLQQFSHAAKVRVTPRDARHIYDTFAIFDASHYLHRFHHDHMRFARGRDEIAGAQALLDRFDELWNVSTPAAAINVLGL